MDFLIQTIDSEIKHDFSFTLLESIKYNNWYNKRDKISYKLTNEETEPGFIPIGSVEFVSKYLYDYFRLKPLPKNIPFELFKYANRTIFNGTYEVRLEKDYFIKSNDKIKDDINGLLKKTDILPEGNYQFSEIIDIDSEYRCFVHKNKLVGLQNYSGDFTIFPDIKTINNIIDDYKKSPVAYTLDVGINDTGTFIVEIHDFFSCGLYGFSDLNRLPYMFSQWYYEFIKIRD